ncbi:MAG TPA: AMP-binding protein [Aliidongia sp.]|uniref:AMP-binding protein n=1 Tax=Aliidongia sp. TaxID=1914230 RepID=UPI002DDD2E8C|nr:AMP-binding protein [Aliidongia sp.]HEV2676103.1 AMP-binding protein [Aliidongia sp.]
MTILPLSRLLAHGRAPDHLLALTDGVPIAYGRFSAEVASAAVRLRATGCRRAALLCQDSYRFAVGLFGLLHAGMTVVMPPNGQVGTLAALGDAFDLLVDDAFLAAPASEAPSLSGFDPLRPAFEFFTSGSTGAPKRIVKTLAMLEHEIAALDRLWGDEMGSGPAVATVSHQHIYGLTFKLLWPLAAGRPFAGEMHELWETLLDQLPSEAVIVASPAHLGRLSGIAPLARARRPRGIFSAGAPLSLSAAAEATTILGVCPTEIFGSTETGAIATRRQIAGDEPWQALPGIAIATDDGGRLKLRSPFLGDGEWFETEDLIEPVERGFHLRGRADRVVKIEGKRISLTDIEQTLARLPWTAAAAAVALPGEPVRLAAVVVPNQAGWEKLAELGRFRFGRLLRQALTETQEPAGLPRLWRFDDHLPSGAMGKRRDADLRALFGIAP